MAQMTFATLTGGKSEPGSIKRWINFDLIEADEVLRDAEAYIAGAMRVREMKATASVTVALHAQTASLPTGFLDPIGLLNPDGSKIDLLDVGALLRWRQRDGNNETIRQPTFLFYAIADEIMHFDVAAETAMTLTMSYWRRPPALSVSNQTNFLTERFPGLLRAACLMHAADYRSDDEKYVRYKARCDELIARANTEADLALKGAIFPVEIADA